MIEELVDKFSGPLLALLGPFAFLLLCAFGFPMPEDIILVAAGILGEKYGHPFILVAIVTYLGIVLGDACIFLMGARMGPRLLQTKVGSFILKEKTLHRAQSALEHYGSWVIFGARFLPGLRTAVFFSSGTLKFSFFRFLLMDGLAALISAPLFVYVGKAAWLVYQSNAQRVEDMIARAQGYALVAAVSGVGAVLLFFLGRYYYRKFR